MANASADQADLLNRLMKSHVWTEAERAAVMAELSEGMEKDRASRMIDKALAEIPKRKAAEAEATPTLAGLADAATVRGRERDVS